MAQTRNQLNEKITQLEQDQIALITALDSLIIEMTNAFNRLLAKIAAGGDFQPEVDKLLTLTQPLVDAKSRTDVAIAEAQDEGV